MFGLKRNFVSKKSHLSLSFCLITHPRVVELVKNKLFLLIQGSNGPDNKLSRAGYLFVFKLYFCGDGVYSSSTSFLFISSEWLT